jgi:DNA-binding MarR family transcriptional regulator
MPNRGELSWGASMRALQRAEVAGSEALSVSEAEEGLISAAILATASLIRRSGNITYRAHLGLAPIEWVIIARLGHHGPLTQTQILERVTFDKGQMSRAVAALIRKRLISREGRTWRSFELRLTPAGAKVHTTVKQLTRERNASLGAGVSSRELRSFFKTLDKIANNAAGLLETAKSGRVDD